MIISERKYKQELRKAFMRGFESGIQHEKEMKEIRKTLNEARSQYGLPTIPPTTGSNIVKKEK